MSSPTSSPIFALGFELFGCNSDLPINGLVGNGTEEFGLKACKEMDNFLYYSNDANDEDFLIADLALKCKRRKVVDNDKKHKNVDKAKLEKKNKKKKL